MPTSGSFLPLASRFSRSARFEGEYPTLSVGITCAQALSLCVNPMPPRITEKSYRPRVSDRTMVATFSVQPFRLLRFRKSDRVGSSSFPSSWIVSERSSPSRVRCAAPNGAPLTAPGRSEEHLPNMRERRVWKLMVTASLHPAFSRPDHAHATTPRGACTTAEGLDAETFSRLPARGGSFSLDILFYRTDITAVWSLPAGLLFRYGCFRAAGERFTKVSRSQWSRARGEDGNGIGR